MKSYKIKDICEVVSGGTPSTKVNTYWNGDIIWLTPKDLSTKKCKWILSSDNRITREGLNNSSAQMLPINTVLLSSRAPIGYVALAGTELCTNQGFKSMICNIKYIHPEYLYYLLQTKVEELNNISTGSTFKELSSGLLKNYKIAIHEIDTQQHIVDILGSIDDSIENNEKIAADLEEYAISKYQEIARGISEFITLGDIVDIYDSKRKPLSSRERESRKGDYRYYGATGVLDYVNDYLFDGEYVLLAEDGTVIDENGYPIVQLVTGQFWVNNHAHIMQAKAGYTNYSLYVALKKLSVNTAVTGAVQLKINQANLCALELPQIDKNKLSAFNQEIEPLFLKIIQIRAEVAKLNELKQLYLHKFFG